MTRGRAPADSLWLRAVLHVPAVIVALLVACYAVDVPYWDTWDWLDRIYPEEAVGQDPTATDGRGRYWPLFNGHRVVVPLLVDEALFSLSSIHVLPRVYLKLPLALATLWLLLGLLRRTSARPAGWPGMLAALTMAALAFPLAYWPMWMDPRQFSMHIVVLTFVASVAVATGAGSAGTRAVATAVLCLVASLSYGPGVLTWPFVFSLLVLHTPRPSPAVLAVWAAAACVVVGLHGVELREGSPYKATAPAGVAAVVHATAAVAGLPVAPAAPALGYKPTRVMGAAGLASFVVLAALCRRKDRRQHALPWIAIGAWAATYVLGVGVARGGLALSAIHEPRFAYGSALLWVAVAALLPITIPARECSAAGSRRWRVVATAAPCVVMAALASASLWPFLAPGGIAALHTQLATGRGCLANYRTAPDSCLELLYPTADGLRVLVSRLERKRAAFLPDPGKQDDAHEQPRSPLQK